MANKKFSQFTAGAAYNPTNDGLARIAGFTTGTTINNIWTPSEIATGLNLTNALQNIYNTDGNITTGNDRVVTIDTGGTLTFAGASAIGDFVIKGGHATAVIQFHSNASGYNYLDAYQLSIRTSNGASSSAFFYSTGKIQFYKDVGFGGIYQTNTRVNIKGESSDNLKWALKCTDSSSNELFSLRNDGVAKFSGQAYTEQHDSLAGNATVNWDNGNVQYIQLASGANTFTPSNPKDGATYILQIKQPSSGAAGTITWGASVKWPAATAPTLSTTNDYIDIVTLIYNGTTTHYYAAATLDLR